MAVNKLYKFTVLQIHKHRQLGQTVLHWHNTAYPVLC